MPTKKKVPQRRVGYRVPLSDGASVSPVNTMAIPARSPTLTSVSTIAATVAPSVAQPTDLLPRATRARAMSATAKSSHTTMVGGAWETPLDEGKRQQDEAADLGGDAGEQIPSEHLDGYAEAEADE